MWTVPLCTMNDKPSVCAPSLDELDTVPGGRARRADKKRGHDRELVVAMGGLEVVMKPGQDRAILAATSGRADSAYSRIEVAVTPHLDRLRRCETDLP
jgi:hypothetical protein